MNIETGKERQQGVRFKDLLDLPKKIPLAFRAILEELRKERSTESYANYPIRGIKDVSSPAGLGGFVMGYLAGAYIFGMPGGALISGGAGFVSGRLMDLYLPARKISPKKNNHSTVQSG